MIMKEEFFTEIECVTVEDEGLVRLDIVQGVCVKCANYFAVQQQSRI